MISDSGLRRRAKAHLRRAPLNLFASTQPGFEPELLGEIQRLDSAAKREPGGVSFVGDLSTIYLANITARSAHKILLRVGEYLTQSYPMLYDHMRRVHWEVFLGRSQSTWFRITTANSRLRHDQHVRATCVSAVNSRLRPLGLAVDPERGAPLQFTVRLYQDRSQVSFDTTGVHLHHRGYRKNEWTAPIRETIAAALLMRLNVARYRQIVDPFCGSGTFLIEASLITRSVAPGASREYAIFRSPLHAEGTLRAAHRMLEGSQVSHDQAGRFWGSDINPGAIAAARKNADAASARICFRTADASTVTFRASTVPSRDLIVTNLPYGRRVGDERVAGEVAHRFSRQLEQARGWDFLVLTRHPTVFQSEWFDIQHRWTIETGGLEVRALMGTVRAN